MSITDIEASLFPRKPLSSSRCFPSICWITSSSTTTSSRGQCHYFGSNSVHLLTSCRYDPDALDNADKDILITFVLTFVSPTYVNNPFLKAKLVTVSLTPYVG